MMRKFILVFAAVLTLGTSFAVTTPSSTDPKPKAPKATEIFLPIGKTGELISLMDLAYASPKELQTLTGKKMSLVDKAGFKVAQRQLRNSINKDGSLDSKKMNKLMKRYGSGEGFQAGGFFLGFLLGLIGVLIAYLINDDQKRNRVKWAWIGVAVSLALYLILLAIVL